MPKWSECSYCGCQFEPDKRGQRFCMPGHAKEKAVQVAIKEYLPPTIIYKPVVEPRLEKIKKDPKYRFDEHLEIQTIERKWKDRALDSQQRILKRVSNNRLTN